jgi:hypothetical protein
LIDPQGNAAFLRALGDRSLERGGTMTIHEHEQHLCGEKDRAPW